MNPLKLLAAPFRYQPWRPRHAPDRSAISSAVDAAAIILTSTTSARRDRLAVSWPRTCATTCPMPAGVGGMELRRRLAAELSRNQRVHRRDVHRGGAGTRSVPDLLDRARRIIDWELSLQRPDGAFPGHFGEPGSEPGGVQYRSDHARHAGRSPATGAAPNVWTRRCARGRWLARIQDADGCWRAFEHNGVPHTYNTRATWALLATALIAGEPALKTAAIRNLEWALAQQRESGWFANNAFVAGRAAVHAHHRLRHPRLAGVGRAARQVAGISTPR